MLDPSRSCGAGLLGAVRWLVRRPRANARTSSTSWRMIWATATWVVTASQRFARRRSIVGREGMRFTQHYAGSAVCAPSRCVLLTGKHAGHAAIRGNYEWPEGVDVWNDRSMEGQRPCRQRK